MDNTKIAAYVTSLQDQCAEYHESLMHLTNNWKKLQENPEEFEVVQNNVQYLHDELNRDRSSLWRDRHKLDLNGMAERLELFASFIENISRYPDTKRHIQSYWVDAFNVAAKAFQEMNRHG